MGKLGNENEGSLGGLNSGGFTKKANPVIVTQDSYDLEDNNSIVRKPLATRRSQGKKTFALIYYRVTNREINPHILPYMPHSIFLLYFRLYRILIR